MTPRDAKGRSSGAPTPPPLPPHLPDPSRRAAGQLAAAATATAPAVEWQTDVNPYRGHRRSRGDADGCVRRRRPRRRKRARWARNSRRRALGDCSEDHPDGLAILAGGRLLRPAPAPVEQGAGRRHTGRRWGGLGAADACQRADGQRGLCPRQRSNICCSLGHLGSFALHRLVHIFA